MSETITEMSYELLPSTDSSLAEIDAILAEA